MRAKFHTSIGQPLYCPVLNRPPQITLSLYSNDRCSGNCRCPLKTFTSEWIPFPIILSICAVRTNIARAGALQLLLLLLQLAETTVVAVFYRKMPWTKSYNTLALTTSIRACALQHTCKFVHQAYITLTRRVSITNQTDHITYPLSFTLRRGSAPLFLGSKKRGAKIYLSENYAPRQVTHLK